MTLFDPSFVGKPAVVLGTGPSLAGQLDLIRELRAKDRIRIFGVNHTWKDLPVDVLICCDPAFHDFYGKIEGPFVQWHWSKEICDRHGYNYIEGVWLVNGVAYPRDKFERAPGEVGGLWIQDKTRISLNHCSSAQALNLAVHYDCDPLLLCGHSFHYQGPKRHYFTGLSDEPGEYPAQIRKTSGFGGRGESSGLMGVYRRIAEQKGLPRIVNCTPDSHLGWFERGNLANFLNG